MDAFIDLIRLVGELAESKYVTMRVPKTEYEKLKKVKNQLRQDPDYSWVESLALGAFVGLLAGYAIKKLSDSDDSL